MTDPDQREGQVIDKAVIPMIDNPHYLKLTGKGQPGHPLYLKKTLGPLKWEV